MGAQEKEEIQMIMQTTELWCDYDEQLLAHTYLFITFLKFMPCAKWYHRWFISRRLFPDGVDHMMLSYFLWFECRNPFHSAVKLVESEYLRVCGKPWSCHEETRQACGAWRMVCSRLPL